MELKLIRKPEWLRVRAAPSGENYTKVKQSLRSLTLMQIQQ